MTGRLEQLGERLELRPRLGVVDALAGVDDGPLGRGEQRGGLAHAAGSGRGADAGRRPVAVGLGQSLLVDVPRDLDQHRPRPAVADLGERPPE